MVSAEATDGAGNVGTASRGTRVAGSGVVVGQVLDDSTSLPLGGASVKLVAGGTGTVETVTDDAGRYSLPVTSSQAVLVAQKDGATSVERSVTVQATGGTVPVDARLTPLADVATGGSAPVVSGPVSIVLPDGASVRLTNLSPQGLLALLPLGFSPVVAFDLRSDATVAGPFAAVLTATGTEPLHLVQYNTGLHEWTMLAPGLTAAADNTVAVDLPALGSYALVAADAGAGAPSVPAACQMLAGVAMATIPADATSATAVDPATLPPSGGKSQGTLALQTTAPMPSGTVVQAQVTETYTLQSGDVASREPRQEDVVLYRRPVPSPVPSGAVANQPSLYATLPIAPSRSYDTQSLKEGKVHLDILADRESVRGATGGSQAVTVQSGDVILAVGSAALPEDTAVDVSPESLSPFLPSGGGLIALEQSAEDLPCGERLGHGPRPGRRKRAPDGPARHHALGPGHDGDGDSGRRLRGRPHEHPGPDRLDRALQPHDHHRRERLADADYCDRPCRGPRASRPLGQRPQPRGHPAVGAPLEVDLQLLGLGPRRRFRRPGPGPDGRLHDQGQHSPSGEPRRPHVLVP